VGEHIAVERIKSGIVDVGDEHAFAQIVEHDNPRDATESTKARSCNSAQMRALERKVSRRTAFLLQPSVKTNNRVRRYLRVSGSRTIGPLP
jgi:hypothetical protein